VNQNSFYLAKPVDAGAFDYDLFFVPTGSGFFELRSFPGGGSHHLPHLVTAVQDIFHIGTETWFDRTADLRVLLNGGVPAGGGGGDAARAGTSFTPAVWVKGSGNWLEQDDKATTSAYGRSYRYNLDRELDVWNLEGGIDFGKKNVLSKGDALVLGLLGGAVAANLDYDELLRHFHFSGGEAGVYATYLNRGLFVDTLFKAALLEIDPTGALGFSGPVDATAGGVRTDSGYRFGGFNGGAFIEPLATIAVVWSDLDNLTISGNQVRFDEGTNVRGRLGLRVGTSYELWPRIRMEPFVIGSVWSNLSGENKATLTSLGTTFPDYTDTPDDLWGVVSTGVNFFSPGTQTSLFAKLDVSFGDETKGIGAKAGARISW
jgi:outer membrane autotransporter protein